MKCQSLFSGKRKKKYFNMSSAENFTQSAYFIFTKYSEESHLNHGYFL